ncbi:hypothetical protein C8Q75DRAFT_804515 [Abortiporus biennis]|nr:hypothetical protein C8Q75DRAFT_804515 [Abortiporus biennis]
MPSREKLILCLCTYCLESSQDDLKGRLMSSGNHITHMIAEKNQRIQQQKDEMDKIAIDLIGLTVTDEGLVSNIPDPSHSESVLPTISELIEGINLIQLDSSPKPSQWRLKECEDSLNARRDVNLKHKLDKLHQDAESVKRHTQSVDCHRKDIYARLEALYTRLGEHSESATGPLIYESAHHYDSPVDHVSSAAQVAIFLGVVCSVVIGIGRQAYNLVLSLLSIFTMELAKSSDGDVNAMRQ